MIPIFDQLDLRNAGAVIDTLAAGASANRTAACRHGSIDHVSVTTADIAAGRRFVLTGDLHDNPLHLARVIRAAGLERAASKSEHPTSDIRHQTSHLTLHELVHGDRLINGMDFSYRVLARVAALKAACPEQVHTLLANHELAQAYGSAVVKNGVRSVDVFNEALNVTFGGDADRVAAAIRDFVLSMPLALRISTEASVNNEPVADVLCAHSLPGPEVMSLFDPTILERDLSDDDYTPRRGSAHLMVWGRGQTPEQLTALAGRWRVGLFILGHEHADMGWMILPPNALILNSDHEHGVYLDFDPRTPRSPEAAASHVRALAG